MVDDEKNRRLPGRLFWFWVDLLPFAAFENSFATF